jgi:MFS family permease
VSIPTDVSNEAPVRWYSGANRGQWLALVAALLGWGFDGFEMGIMPVVARPALVELLGLSAENSRAKELADRLKDSALPAEEQTRLRQELVSARAAVDEPVRRWNGTFNATFLIGAALGGLVFGWIGDRVGRVRAMIFSVLTYALFTGFCGLVATAWQLGLLRSIAALGMGGEWALGVALVMESWPARARPVLAGLIGSSANFGFMIAAVLAYLIKPTGHWQPPESLAWLASSSTGIGTWRLLLLACVVPALLTFLLRTFVPESTKWKHATATGPRSGLTDIFASGLRHRSVLGATLGAIALLATWGGVQMIPLWVGQADADKAQLAQIDSAAGAVLGAFLGAVLGERWGRRQGYFLLCLGSLVVCEGLFLGQGNSDFGWLFFGSVFLVGAFSASFYGWLPLYLPELFPTRVRAAGQGFCYNFGRTLAAVGVLLTTFAVDLKGNFARASALVCLVYVVGLVIAWRIPETRGRPLPD